MNINDKSLLEVNGWTVLCESPLEIRHEETGSDATGIAVRYVIDGLKEEAEREDE